MAFWERLLSLTITEVFGTRDCLNKSSLCPLYHWPIGHHNQPKSELMFSVPKAVLFRPSAAEHVGQDSCGCHGASSRDRGCSLTGNLISELSEKNSLCFINRTVNTPPWIFLSKSSMRKKISIFCSEEVPLCIAPTFPSPSTSAFHRVLLFSFYLSGDKGDSC